MLRARMPKCSESMEFHGEARPRCSRDVDDLPPRHKGSSGGASASTSCMTAMELVPNESPMEGNDAEPRLLLVSLPQAVREAASALTASRAACIVSAL